MSLLNESENQIYQRVVTSKEYRELLVKGPLAISFNFYACSTNSLRMSNIRCCCNGIKGFCGFHAKKSKHLLALLIYISFLSSTLQTIFPAFIKKKLVPKALRNFLNFVIYWNLLGNYVLLAYTSMINPSLLKNINKPIYAFA